MDSDNKWYIVNVMAGQENKVAADIKAMMIRGETAKQIKDVLVPVKQITKIKRGQKIQETQKLFPGYIFVNIDISGDIYSLITSIPKVMGFLGSKNNPQPVSESKMLDIIKLSNEQSSSDGKSVIFEIGETLNVIEGPFESFSGTVEDFDIEKQKVKISVLIFGRATSVELNIDQVEKLS